MEFRLQARGYTDPDVVRLVAAVQAEYVELYGGPDEAVVEPEEFSLPTGSFFVGLADGTAVATGGWRRLDERSAEIKRMYVVPGYRRLGFARRMLDQVESSAAAAGLEQLVLNTGDRQPEAIALYESAGYVATPGFGRYADTTGAVFLAKSLT